MCQSEEAPNAPLNSSAAVLFSKQAIEKEFNCKIRGIHKHRILQLNTGLILLCLMRMEDAVTDSRFWRREGGVMLQGFGGRRGEGYIFLFWQLSDAVHLEDHVVYLRSCLMQYTWRIIGALEITLMRFLDSKIERTSVCRRLQSPSLSPCNNGINQTCNDKNNNREVAKKSYFDCGRTTMVITSTPSVHWIFFL